MNDKRLSRSQWLQTPYAASTAQRTEEAVTNLLGKYGVQEFQWTQGRGPHGRPGVQFRFLLRGRAYRVMVETLNAEAAVAELLLQAKRAIYYYLKSALEMASVFVPLEKALFAFMELPGGWTPYELAEEKLQQMDSTQFSMLVGAPPRPALPGADA